MTIETALYPNQLNASWPAQSDIVREGAGHIRAGCLMGSTMPRTQEEFNNYVAQELRARDKRMDEIVKTVAAIQIEQASAKVLLAENTDTIKEIKTDTADMLEVFESWKGAMRVMEMIGKLAKPLGYIIGLGASIAAFWTAMKSGVSPK